MRGGERKGGGGRKDGDGARLCQRGMKAQSLLPPFLIQRCIGTREDGQALLHTFQLMEKKKKQYIAKQGLLNEGKYIGLF